VLSETASSVTALVLCVYALDGVAFRLIDLVVVDFFQVYFAGRVVHVVFVRRIADSCRPA
jgi:hypothetical protein